MSKYKYWQITNFQTYMKNVSMTLSYRNYRIAMKYTNKSLGSMLLMTANNLEQLLRAFFIG